jgi:hypothetical protein
LPALVGGKGQSQASGSWFNLVVPAGMITALGPASTAPIQVITKDLKDLAWNRQMNVYPGPIQRGVLTGKPPAACSGTKREPLHHHKSGSVDEHLSRSPQDAVPRFVNQAGLITCERTSVFAAEASVVSWYGPQADIDSRGYTAAKSGRANQHTRRLRSGTGSRPRAR